MAAGIGGRPRQQTAATRTVDAVTNSSGSYPREAITDAAGPPIFLQAWAVEDNFSLNRSTYVGHRASAG